MPIIYQKISSAPVRFTWRTERTLSELSTTICLNTGCMGRPPAGRVFIACSMLGIVKFILRFFGTRNSTAATLDSLGSDIDLADLIQPLSMRIYLHKSVSHTISNSRFIHESLLRSFGGNDWNCEFVASVV